MTHAEHLGALKVDKQGIEQRLPSGVTLFASDASDNSFQRLKVTLLNPNPHSPVLALNLLVIQKQPGFIGRLTRKSSDVPEISIGLVHRESVDEKQFIKQIWPLCNGISVKSADCHIEMGKAGLQHGPNDQFLHRQPESPKNDIIWTHDIFHQNRLEQATLGQFMNQLNTSGLLGSGEQSKMLTGTLLSIIEQGFLDKEVSTLRR